MKPWAQILSRSAQAGTPLWLDPLAWSLAFSSVPAASYVGNILIQLELVYVCILLGALGSVAFLLRRSREFVFSWLLYTSVFAVAFIGGLRWRFEICQTNLVRVTGRAQPLVDAITAFQADHGRPPAALDDLVPKYIDRIPKTGIGMYPEFRYWTGRANQHHGNEWVLSASPPCVVFGFDSFYYYPRQNYAEAGFGEIGNWGYHRD